LALRPKLHRRNLQDSDRRGTLATMSFNVLVTEDDERIGASVKAALVAAGYHVVLARSGEEALLAAAAQRFDLLVLDIGLPGRDGLTVLRALREGRTDLAVLILSSRSEIQDRVTGLQAGADDYLTKPFSMAELEARVQALLRRSRNDPATCLGVGDLSVDVPMRKATRAGSRLELTVLEFELLELLMRRAHTVVSRETITRGIWKDVNRETPLDNVIDVHIGRLRKKIDGAGQSALIHTVRGVGFMLSDRGPK
jgi:two-component system, OmpR family, copper resistance phosphate regulon response regulator CusR